VAAYSIYSQLAYIAAGRFLYLLPEDMLCYGDKRTKEDFNVTVGREDILKPTTGNESLQEISNDNGVRVVNLATSKNLTVKSIMFPHCNIHKYTLMCPAAETHN
jgi:hypothetical protein